MSKHLYCSTQRCDDPQQSREAALEENPLNEPASPTGGRRKRGVTVHSRLWAPGRQLRIAFEGDVACDVQQAVMSVACQWTCYGNISFVLIQDLARAHIRIQMLPSGSDINRSYIGTDALRANDPTMTLSEWPGDEHFVRNVLHEFGHVLGLEHEHQHPDADIPWNTEKLLAAAQAGGLSEADIRRDFLDRIERRGSLLRPYDRDSIMHYPIPNGATLGDWSVGVNAVLSEGDKALMGLAYPYP
ncbi:peptidase M12 [Pseudomonas sp. MAFF212428]|uniref:Peptidase M12 n=1 Tax=Pseudomonas brassicae TaxID=2708063 RepID=A0A6B3NTJ5_9PSED|nr:M12 family metallopeptidase [Pseudomonas brassicae]NER58876.1 peptidase M12 [Pseudomonas brassicae]NER62634.1 peptidase M12 [Pseudomonas brassicae]